MKISAFADTCLRILMRLAAAPDTRATSESLAQAIDVPYNHVSKAVLDLRRRGFVDATRGRNGGVMIAPAGLRASVGALARDLDPDLDPVTCIRADGTACPLIAGCRLRSALHTAREAFYRTLDPLVVADLVPEAQSGACDSAGPTPLPFPEVPDPRR
ncbi:RrF2 family transcriptional regulator [Brevibacterium litoralis]|uniref:RrF2 family transcriptional regulator n=1 Tax=Brevibacterium litoralis TaxID=3138935 RepID=UPI0032EE4323